MKPNYNRHKMHHKIPNNRIYKNKQAKQQAEKTTIRAFNRKRDWLRSQALY